MSGTTTASPPTPGGREPTSASTEILDPTFRIEPPGRSRFVSVLEWLRNNYCDFKPPLMFRLKGTVILRIWSQVLLHVGFAMGVVFFHKFVPGMHMSFQLTMTHVLGIVIGLLLVFRTNTAYDR